MSSSTPPGPGSFGPPPPPQYPASFDQPWAGMYPPPPPHVPAGRPAVGMILVLAGLLVLALGMGVLDWLTFEGFEGEESTTFTATAGAFFGDGAEEVIGGYEHAYMKYLAWLTACAGALTAVLSTLPWPGAGNRGLLRGSAVLVCAFGLVSTIVLAVSLLDLTEDEEADMSLSVGPWVTVAGFAVLALGALLGPPTNARQR